MKIRVTRVLLIEESGNWKILKHCKTVCFTIVFLATIM